MNSGEGTMSALMIITMESMARQMPDVAAFLEQMDATELQMEREGKPIPKGLSSYRNVVAAVGELQKAVRAHDALGKEAGAKPPEVKIEV